MIVDKYKDQVDARSLCHALDVSSAAYYRSRKMPSAPPPPRRSCRRLEDSERKEVLTVLTSDEFVDKTVPETYYTLLDRGVHLCSISTMYKILRENQAVKERRHQRRHPEYVKPVLKATAPNQVWSWDITRLVGVSKGVYYYLYKMMDIYSRYTVGWTVAPRENGTIARHFIETTCARQGIKPEQLVIHSDRGSPMKSQTVTEMMLNLGILKSFSRPRVSNDNPYSESLFKTLKYHPTFPEKFGSIEDACEFLRNFFDWYNCKHYHSGIAMMAPDAVHHGKTEIIIQQRQKSLKQAWEKHPERFVRGLPTPKNVPAEAWINQPCQQILEAA